MKTSGTGETLPFSCFPTETERATFYGDLLQMASNSSDTAVGEVWSMVGWLAEYCKASEQANEVGELVGTAFTARDMMQIVDALGEDGMLRFWGEYSCILPER
jgi:hypothetical protein